MIDWTTTLYIQYTLNPSFSNLGNKIKLSFIVFSKFKKIRIQYTLTPPLLNAENKIKIYYIL